MLPGRLQVGRNDLLTSPLVVKRAPVSRSMGGMTVPLAVMRRVLHLLSTWRALAAGRRALAELDDHLLHDIGLTYADVERELMKPFWRA